MLSGKQGIINGRCANNQFRKTFYSLFHDSLRVIEQQKMSESNFELVPQKSIFRTLVDF